jgi:hypothetical protein
MSGEIQSDYIKKARQINQAGLMIVRRSINSIGDQSLIAFEWQQCHKAGSFDCIGNGVLADRRATRLASSNDPAMTIDQFLKQLDVFVVDIHRTRTLTIDVKWIFTNGSGFCFGLAPRRFFSEFSQGTATSI